MDLGNVPKRGFLNPSNPVLAGGWTVEFGPQDLPRDACEAYHAAVKGPIGSTFQVFLGTTFYDNVPLGDINSWDPTQPMFLSRGTTVFYHFSSASAPAPVVTLFFRSVSVL